MLLWQRVCVTNHDSEAALQIDILEVEGKYYGFSGCHRYEVQHHVHMPNHQTVNLSKSSVIHQMLMHNCFTPVVDLMQGWKVLFVISVLHDQPTVELADSENCC